jgi:hypothetical protein
MDVTRDTARVDDRIKTLGSDTSRAGHTPESGSG